MTHEQATNILRRIKGGWPIGLTPKWRILSVAQAIVIRIAKLSERARTRHIVRGIVKKG